MGIADDLVLITTDPRNGRSLLGSTEADAVLGGALLVDLVLAERCAIEGETKKAKVRLVDPTPLGRAAPDQALGRLRPDKQPKASSVVPKLGKGSRPLLSDELVAAGALSARREKMIGLFPVTYYDVIDPARHQRVLGAVQQVLAGQTAPDDTTGPLIGLLSAADVIGKLVPKHERSEAKRRAKEIAKGDWGGAAVDAAVTAAAQAASAAAAAAIMVVFAGAAGASSGGS